MAQACRSIAKEEPVRVHALVPLVCLLLPLLCLRRPPGRSELGTERGVKVPRGGAPQDRNKGLLLLARAAVGSVAGVVEVGAASSSWLAKDLCKRMIVALPLEPSRLGSKSFPAAFQPLVFSDTPRLPRSGPPARRASPASPGGRRRR